MGSGTSAFRNSLWRVKAKCQRHFSHRAWFPMVRRLSDGKRHPMKLPASHAATDQYSSSDQQHMISGWHPPFGKPGHVAGSPSKRPSTAGSSGGAGGGGGRGIDLPNASRGPASIGTGLKCGSSNPRPLATRSRGMVPRLAVSRSQIAGALTCGFWLRRPIRPLWIY
jgi:hypothetical protein